MHCLLFRGVCHTAASYLFPFLLESARLSTDTGLGVWPSHDRTPYRKVGHNHRRSLCCKPRPWWRSNPLRNSTWVKSPFSRRLQHALGYGDPILFNPGFHRELRPVSRKSWMLTSHHQSIKANTKYNNAKRSIPAHPTFVNDAHRDLHLWL